MAIGAVKSVATAIPIRENKLNTNKFNSPNNERKLNTNKLGSLNNNNDNALRNQTRKLKNDFAPKLANPGLEKLNSGIKAAGLNTNKIATTYKKTDTPLIHPNKISTLDNSEKKGIRENNIRNQQEEDTLLEVEDAVNLLEKDATASIESALKVKPLNKTLEDKALGKDSLLGASETISTADIQVNKGLESALNDKTGAKILEDKVVRAETTPNTNEPNSIQPAEVRRGLKSALEATKSPSDMISEQAEESKLKRVDTNISQVAKLQSAFNSGVPQTGGSVNLLA